MDTLYYQVKIFLQQFF